MAGSLGDADSANRWIEMSGQEAWDVVTGLGTGLVLAGIGALGLKPSLAGTVRLKCILDCD